MFNAVDYRGVNLWSELQELIRNEKALLQGNFTFASGIQSPVYFDGRKVNSHPRGIELVGMLIARHVEYEDFTVMGGPATGAIAMAIAASLVLSRDYDKQIPTFFIRSEEKTHGTEKIIEGTIYPGCRVIVLEDTISTGRSVLAAIKELEKLGCEVIRIIALAYYPSLGGLKHLEDLGYKCTALYNIEDMTSR